MPERLQKVLARAGFGSRRACEELITAGEVEVDGKTITELGTRVDPDTQKIRCQGRVVQSPRKMYLALNKPRRTISSTRDERGRRTIMDLTKSLPVRVYPVGRLDFDSEGLILLTNDGEFCNLMTHPRYRVTRTYHVVLRGRLTPEVQEKISKGVWLSDGRTGPVKIRVKKAMQDTTIAEVTIREGINREVRRIFARSGLKVMRLKRIRIGSVSLGVLPRGAYRMLNQREVNSLVKLAREEETTAPRPRRRRK
jgi:pseudouridine synthase